MTESVLWMAAGCFMCWGFGFLLGKVIRLIENFFVDAVT